MPVKLGLPSNTNIAAAVLCLLASWDVNILEFKVIPLSLEARTDHLSFLTLGELPLAGTAQAEWVAQHFWIKL